MYCILDFRRSSLSSFFFSTSFRFFFGRGRGRERAILPESERDNDRFAFVGLITYRWKRVCQPRTADGGGGWPDERGGERERETERKDTETCVYNNNNLLRCLNDFQLLLPRTVRANKSWSIKLHIIMHARARAPAPDLFDRRRTQLSYYLRVQHGLRNGYDTRPIIILYLPYKRNSNNCNNNRERINNIIIFDSVHAIPSTLQQSTTQGIIVII